LDDDEGGEKVEIEEQHTCQIAYHGEEEFVGVIVIVEARGKHDGVSIPTH
jgi:hypothetical protein